MESMTITNFADLIAAAQAAGPKRVAVAAAADHEVLLSLVEARDLGIATGILVGDWPAIEAIAQQHGLDLREMAFIHEPDPIQAAQRAVALARDGEVDVVAKGQLKTPELLRAVLDRKTGIRGQRLLSHVGIFDIPGFERLIYISDSGVVLEPDIYQKLEIIQNVVEVAHKFGLREPKVAILAATEEVHPKVPASVDALALARMASQGWVEGAIVDGPMALDTAISPASSRIKGISGPVAGQADILIVPNVAGGNIMAKGILYFARARMAGVVVGARVPILINSRADTADTRLLSIAMAVVLATR